jgi:hypothetical protein
MRNYVFKATSAGLKGHESPGFSLALAWVYVSNGSALKLKGRQKIVLLEAA